MWRTSAFSRGRRPAQAARRNRRRVWPNAICERACLPAQARTGRGPSDIGGAPPHYGDVLRDLVGSTSLAARLDAEDWRNLVGAYLDRASAAVRGLGGHALKKLGDGLMALFGYPQAQENDAERAVRAALAIQRALADLNARNARSGAPWSSSARIGIEFLVQSWSIRLV